MKIYKHIDASLDEIAPIVLMPGDPLRAKSMVEKYLINPKLVNKQRNMLAYTGMTKDNKPVTIMGSGMGPASIGIYSYELFKYYNVDKIIRVGTCGGLKPEIEVYDIVLAATAVSHSSYAQELNYSDKNVFPANASLLEQAIQASLKLDTKPVVGEVISTTAFHRLDRPKITSHLEVNCVAAEMETFALYANAEALNKKALGIFTVSDTLDNKMIDSKERETACHKMFLIALELANQEK